MDSPAVVIEHATKRFGALTAVREASVTFSRGRLHAIVGENGAGKSTLLSLAAGALALDGGTVLVHGKPLLPATPAEAIRRGIGFVHQHFMLIDAFSVLENIIVGAEPMRSVGRIDWSAARKAAEAKMRELDLELDLQAPVAKLGVGERQTLEIVRVLVRGANIILLDEPTAVLTPGQADQLYATLRRMASQGAAVVVVTHRLGEVMRYCDDVTVMRRGQVIESEAVANTTIEALTRAIMGKEPPPPVRRPDAPDESAVTALDIEKLTIAGQRDQRAALQGVSLHVRQGEIVGVAGVEGNGQQELVHAIAGLRSASSGAVRLGPRDITHATVAQRRELGLAVVHADRHREGLLLDAPVGANLMLGQEGTPLETAVVGKRIERFGIVPPDAQVPARSLSGGNQQKVVTARALDRQLQAVVLAQPTRGVDLGAARAIHECLCEAARQGAGVLVVSADLAELRALCHRIVVMARGRIVAQLSPEASEEQFGAAMLGSHEGSA